MADEAPQALYQHCEAVYNRMLQEAKPLEADDGSQIIVWEGMLTSFITNKMNLSVPYYTKVTQALKGMGCIRQLKRGGGTAPSLWELIEEPTEEKFRVIEPPKRKRPSQNALIQEQIDNLNGRLSKLENILQNLIKEETANG